MEDDEEDEGSEAGDDNESFADVDDLEGASRHRPLLYLPSRVVRRG